MAPAAPITARLPNFGLAGKEKSPARARSRERGSTTASCAPSASSGPTAARGARQPSHRFSVFVGLGLRNQRSQLVDEEALARPIPGTSSSSSSATSGAAAWVTKVGGRPCSIVSLVTTHLETSRREGSSNWTSSSVSSRIERRPRAPVSRSSALSAIAPSESSWKLSSISSNSKKRWNWLISALRARSGS